MEINKQPTTTAGGSTKVEPTYAFPMVGQIVTKVNPITGQQDIMSFVQTGMELRDYLAAQVVHGVAQMVSQRYDWSTKKKMTQEEQEDESKVFYQMVALHSYQAADAMLAERSKVKP